MLSPTRLLLLPSLLSLALAALPQDRKCVSTLCLTSFKWCGSTECDFPDMVYPQNLYPGPFPTIIWKQDYQLSWTQTDHDTPVTLRWTFEDERGNYSARWEDTITDGSNTYTFTPTDTMFPNPLSPNLTYEHAAGILSIHTSYLSIYQFADSQNQNTSDASNPGDMSDIFLVNTGWVAKFIRTAVEVEHDRMHKRLAIAVGVGVGVTWFVAYLVGWVTAGWWAKRRARKEGRKG